MFEIYQIVNCRKQKSKQKREKKQQPKICNSTKSAKWNRKNWCAVGLEQTKIANQRVKEENKNKFEKENQIN